MARYRFSPMLCLLLLSALASVLPSTSAKEIECIVPHRMGEGKRPVYNTGESVQFQWSSGFPRFDLTITQVNSATQMRTNDRIFENEPNTTANFVWEAHNFDGLSQDDPFHLWITNADDATCETCHCRSANFTVLAASADNTSTTSASAGPSATAPSASTTSASASASSDEHLKLGLGLGLGLGIPLLITLTALATWLCVRRRRRQPQRHAHPDGLSLTYSPNSAVSPNYPHQHSPGYVSSASEEKSPAPEADGHPVVEMQSETWRVEAPAETYRAELAGDEARGMLGGQGPGDVKMM